MNLQNVYSVDQRYRDTAEAFDSVAFEYNGTLGNNRLVQHMRAQLWHSVVTLASPGARLLDLGCGTGLDAVHFAQLGYDVTAIDGSTGMVAQTKRLAAKCNVSTRVHALHLGMQQLSQLSGEHYDLIYSDMGALNCLADLAPISDQCASLLSSLGQAVFSVMGRFCPWELLFYNTRGQRKRSQVRFSHGQIPVSLNGRTVWTRYYTPRELYHVFTRSFALKACRALNLFLPPPYLIGVIDRHPAIFRPLAWLDRHVGQLPLFNQTGDHFLLEMTRHE